MKNLLKNKIFLASILGVTLIFVATFFINLKPVEAFPTVIIPLKAFGGEITYVNYCCNGLELTISGPKGINSGSYFIDYSSIANPEVNYMNYQIFYGGSQPAIGLAIPFGYCVDIAAECEAGHTTSGGTIVKIGTGFPGSK